MKRFLEALDDSAVQEPRPATRTPQKSLQVGVNKDFASYLNELVKTGIVKNRAAALRMIYGAISGDNNSLVTLVQKRSPELAEYLMQYVNRSKQVIQSLNIDQPTLKALAEIGVEPLEILGTFAKAFGADRDTTALRTLMDFVASNIYPEHQPEILAAFSKFAVDKNKHNIASIIDNMVGKGTEKVNLSPEAFTSIAKLLVHADPTQTRQLVNNWMLEHPEMKSALDSALAGVAQKERKEPLDLFMLMLNELPEIRKDLSSQNKMSRRKMMGIAGSVGLGVTGLASTLYNMVKSVSMEEDFAKGIADAKQSANKEAFRLAQQKTIKLDKNTDATFKLDQTPQGYNAVVTIISNVPMSNLIFDNVYTKVQDMLAKTGLVVNDGSATPRKGQVIITFPVKDMNKFTGFNELKSGEYHEGFASWLATNELYGTI